MHTESLSVGIVITAVVLLGAISCLHLWSFRRKAPIQRTAYSLIIGALLVGTLFVTILDGDDKIAPLSVGQAYGILAIPEFYRTNAGDIATNVMVFAVPVIHNLTCIFLASVIVRVARKTEQDGDAE